MATPNDSASLAASTALPVPISVRCTSCCDQGNPILQGERVGAFVNGNQPTKKGRGKGKTKYNINVRPHTKHTHASGAAMCGEGQPVR